MGGQFRENWKRLADKLPANNTSQDNTDVTRFQDLAIYSGTLTAEDLHINHTHYDISSVAPPHEEGVSYWDSDDHTLNLMTDISGTTIQVGQESVLRAVNRTGSGILNGQVVYLSGAQGNRPSIALASALNHEDEQQTIGITTSNIDDNQIGYITTFGLVRGIDTSHIPEGSGVFLSDTSGEFQLTPPNPPSASTYLGVVARSHATNGILFVKIIDRPGVHELHDVDTTNLQDGDVLSWETASSTWINSTPAAGSGSSGALQHLNVAVSSAEILTSNSSPVEIIPAPPAGFANIVERVVVRNEFLSSAYAYNSNAKLTYTNGFGTTIVSFGALFLEENETVYTSVNSEDLGTGGGLVVSLVDAKPIVFSATTANPTNGAGSLVFDIYYYTIPTS